MTFLISWNIIKIFLALANCLKTVICHKTKTKETLEKTPSYSSVFLRVAEPKKRKTSLPLVFPGCDREAIKQCLFPQPNRQKAHSPNPVYYVVEDRSQQSPSRESAIESERRSDSVESEQVRLALLNAIKNIHFTDMLLMQNILKNLNVPFNALNSPSDMEDDTW